ncbi:hypothetical protein DITRI_Ditri08aG0086900 [Diplodiscus trichospermus]
MGDFNEFLSHDDKHGSHPHPDYLIRAFRDAVVECGLIDLPLIGHEFTWERGRGTDAFVKEKLNRCLVDLSWVDLFPEARLMSLVASVSDHCPVELNTDMHSYNGRVCTFRFENSWLMESDFNETVNRCWVEIGGLEFLEKLKRCVEVMDGWGKEFRNQFKNKIRKEKAALTEAIRSNDADSMGSVSLYRKNLNELPACEETYWKQRAKKFWLKGGDLNRKYFHASSTARKKANQINKLKRDDEVWVEDRMELNEVAREYFASLFADDDQLEMPNVDYICPKVTADDNEILMAPFTVDEFKKVVFQMHPDNSPGPDGFNPAFYQQFWPHFGMELFPSCINWLNTGDFPLTLQDTLITLIPKKENPKTMRD